MNFFIDYLVVGLIMAGFDAFWLSVVANKFYKSQIGSLLLDKPNFIAAVAFYLVYIFGIVVFVLQPALQAGSLMHAFGYGALFGLVAYATYDLTNLSTLKGYKLKLTIVDMAWGIALTSIVSLLAYVVVHR